ELVDGLLIQTGSPVPTSTHSQSGPKLRPGLGLSPGIQKRAAAVRAAADASATIATTTSRGWQTSQTHMTRMYRAMMLPRVEMPFNQASGPPGPRRATP